MDDIFPYGLEYIHFESIDSTNKYAKENSDSIKNAVIVAENQYAGVGKNASSWWSSPYKSILATIVLSVDTAIDKIAMYPLFIGALIHEVLEKHGVSSSIKWPNDIYICGKKAVGILCESIIKDNRVSKLVIGMGINVNQTRDELITDEYTSLYSCTGRKFNRQILLADILSEFFSRLPDTIEDKMKFAKKIVDKNLYLKGERIEFISDKLYTGDLLGITRSGELLIQTEEGPKGFISGKILMD